ncbi:MAG: hypothetical protein R3F20_04080 [Planctomycetota bacterium]
MPACRAVALIALLLVPLSGGCAEVESTPDAGAETALPAAGGRTDWETRHAIVAAAVDEGRHADALDLVDAVFAEDPPPVWSGRFQLLQFRAKREFLRRDCFDAEIVVDREHYVIGDVIDGEVVLLNRSRWPVRIPAVREVPEPDGRGTVASKTIFARAVTYREYRPDDTVVTQTDSRNIIVDEDVLLEPGESFRVPVALDTTVNNIAGTMLRTYTFACSLRAAQIEVGERSFNEELEFRPVTVRVYPRNADHLAEDPLASLGEALARRSPVHVTLAASFAAELEDREPLFAALETALADESYPEVMHRAIMTSLVIATSVDGEPVRRDRDGWLDWLRRRLR